MKFKLVLYIILVIINCYESKHNLVIRFRKDMITPDGHPQLECIGGNAKDSNEEAKYLICESNLFDIYSEYVVWNCKEPTSSLVKFHKLKIYCPKFENVIYSYGDDHPCSAEYNLEYNFIPKNGYVLLDSAFFKYLGHEFSKVLGWSILGIIFFYLLLKRNNNIYNTQINNPMSLPREQINPKVFRTLGIIVSVVVFISTVIFILLSLLMFSAPI